MAAFLRTILGDNTELLKDAEHQCPDPFNKFLAHIEQQELQKSLPGVTDESWNASLESSLEEAFGKAIESATAAVKKFVENNAQRLMTERIPWEELRKSFREEQQCQRQ